MENHDTSLPLMYENFRNRIFPQPGKVPLWNFSVMWYQKISTENRDTRSRIPLLSIKFSIPEIFRNKETKRGSPTKCFGTVRQNNFDGKSWYTPPSFILNIFRYQKFFLKHRRVPLRYVSAQWDKNNFNGKSWYLPPSLISNVFWYQKFSGAQKDSSTIFFGTVRENSFDRKSWYNSLMHKIFRYPKLVNLKGFLRKVSVLWEKTISAENRDTRPLLLFLTFFDTRNFLEHRRVSYEKFRYCERKQFRRKIVIAPPPFYPQTFSIPEIFWNTEGFPCEFFRHCKTQHFERKIVIHPLSH